MAASTNLFTNSPVTKKWFRRHMLYSFGNLPACSRFAERIESKGRQIMKTHVLALVAGLLLSMSASAQTYTIDWLQGETISGTPGGGTVKREGTIRNLNNTAKELYFSYDLNGLSLDHTAQLCMNSCWSLYPGPGDDPYIRDGQVLSVGGTLPLYVDLTPHGTEGTSLVQVSLFDKTNTNDKLNFSVTFKIAPSTSVRDASEIGLSVGPLPATESVSVRGDVLPTITTIGLYDASGNIVRSYGVPTSTVATLPLSGLASGTYRLIMTSADGSMSASPVVITR